MIARVASDAEADELRDPLRFFRCALAPVGAQYPPQYEMSVEWEIRNGLWRWRYEPGTAEDPRLLVIDSWDDGIAALAGHEQVGDGLRQITVVAVSAELRARGHGLHVFATALVDAAARCPGGRAYWYVHEDNRTSRHLSETKLQADLVYDPAFADDDDPPDVPDHVLYSIDL